MGTSTTLALQPASSGTKPYLGLLDVVPDWTINPPPADEKFVPIANAGATQKLTDACFPGFAVTLPAGVSIIGWDGVPKSRIAVERIPVDKLPVPLPSVPIKVAGSA